MRRFFAERFPKWWKDHILAFYVRLAVGAYLTAITLGFVPIPTKTEWSKIVTLPDWLTVAAVTKIASFAVGIWLLLSAGRMWERRRAKKSVESIGDGVGTDDLANRLKLANKSSGEWKQRYLDTHAKLESVENRTELRKQRVDDMLRRLRDWRYAWDAHRRAVLIVIAEHRDPNAPRPLDKGMATGAKLIEGWSAAWTRFYNEIIPTLHDGARTDSVPRLVGDLQNPSLPSIDDHERRLILWIDETRRAIKQDPDIVRENFEGFKAWDWPFPYIEAISIKDRDVDQEAPARPAPGRGVSLRSWNFVPKPGPDNEVAIEFLAFNGGPRPVRLKLAARPVVLYGDRVFPDGLIRLMKPLVPIASGTEGFFELRLPLIGDLGAAISADIETALAAHGALPKLVELRKLEILASDEETESVVTRPDGFKISAALLDGAARWITEPATFMQGRSV